MPEMTRAIAFAESYTAGPRSSSSMGLSLNLSRMRGYFAGQLLTTSRSLKRLRSSLAQVGRVQCQQISQILRAKAGCGIRCDRVCEVETYVRTLHPVEEFEVTNERRFGATYVMNGTTFTIGMLVAFQMFASRVSQPMLRMVGLWQQFQQASLSVARLGDIMYAPMEPYSLVPGRVRGGRGQIDIEGLSFRYEDNLPLLLKGLNLTIEPGRMVAFMGPSGCGKSTLAKLLQGLYRPTDGRITLDGNDITYLAANELRINFGVVPQETILFSGTVYENLISAHPHATFEQVTKACQIAEIHEVIEKLPKGYQTEIGERGVGLSGGQKQRMAIARALIKQPKILIFDEATSCLDVATAEHFCATINQLKGKVTMLFIKHALPKNLQIDEIVQIGVTRLSPESTRNSLGVVETPA